MSIDGRKAVLAAALLTIAGCLPEGHSIPAGGPTDLAGESAALEAGLAAPAAIEVRSEALSEGRAIPARFTCDGRNLSPDLTWSGVPEKAQSLVVILSDPDAPRGTFAHWVVFNLPPDLDALPAGVEPTSAIGSSSEGADLDPVQATNDFHNVGYDGPCPPEGPAHRYVFQVYALDTILNLDAAATRDDVLGAIKGHVIGEGRLTGTYARAGEAG